MLHEPAPQQQGKDHAVGYKTSLGVKMFFVYAIVYAGFVLINLVKPVLMEKTIVFGLNLAVVYGVGLIIFALALALVYNHKCNRRENGTSNHGTEPEEDAK